jgi:transposase
MPKLRREQIGPTDEWGQLQLLVQFPEQRAYELLRPVVLFGLSPAERARQTRTPQRTLYRQADRFEREGMRSLFEKRVTIEKHKALPEEVRKAILDLKAEYPQFRPHEIKTICYVRFGRSVGHHTVKRVLAEGRTLERKKRRFKPYHHISDPYDRRHAVVTLHAEGWNAKTIAAYLEVHRSTVYDTLRRWVEEGVGGLDDRSRARKDGVRKVDLKAIAEVKRLQENPEIGAFRIHAALKRMGIDLSPRTCGRILARNRQLYGLPKPDKEPKALKQMPFAASHRHEYWTVDIRYIDNDLVGGRIYCISILENYSRSILASGLSQSQDLTAYLIVLYAAIRQHGAPEGLVSDGGGVFRAKQAQQVYRALGIDKQEIERRQPWQSYIESNFNVQRRMVDWDFARAECWERLLQVHDKWVVDFNYQVHWAHRQRTDGRQSPAEVLGWIHGRQFEPEELHRVFYSTRFGRKINTLGYVRFRHWRVYAEHGLADERAAVWLYGENLTLEYADEPLARYKVRYQPDNRNLLSVGDPHLYETPHRSPQPPLWELGDGEWLKVVRLPGYAPRRKHGTAAVQARLHA